jgi:hypothetical protein
MLASLVAQASSTSSTGSTIMGWLILIVIVLAIAGKVTANKEKGGGRPISQAGARAEGGKGQLLCPNCGGAQFKAKRSAAAKAVLIPTVGVGALLAPKSRVKCETCGTVFLRG